MQPFYQSVTKIESLINLTTLCFCLPTWTSVARVSYVSLRQCQFCRPRVSATPGRLKAQCLAISVSTVWARAGSVIERYWSNSCWGMTFWRRCKKNESFMIKEDWWCTVRRNLIIKSNKSLCQSIPAVRFWSIRAGCKTEVLSHLDLRLVLRHWAVSRIVLFLHLHTLNKFRLLSELKHIIKKQEKTLNVKEDEMSHHSSKFSIEFSGFWLNSLLCV